MSGTNKVIIENNGSGVIPYLPLDKLNARSTSQETK
jgi:hypothetical protein